MNSLWSGVWWSGVCGSGIARMCAGWLAFALASGRAAGAGAGDGSRREGPPLWEVGVVGTVSRIPDYRGSDEYTTYTIPFPYFIYRGDILRLNRGGVKAVYLQTEHLQADFSFSGNPPVRDNEARDGMPNLDALLECGPALRWLFTPRGSPRMLYAQASVRGGFSVDWGGWGPEADYEGLYGGIRLTGFSRMARIGSPRGNAWGYGASLGVDFSDAQYSDFFYGVDPVFAREDRPAYSGRGGYAGSWISAHVTRRFSRRVTFAVFSKWDNLDGAVFDDSPLVRERNSFIVACALTWTLGEWGESVRSDEPEDE